MTRYLREASNMGCGSPNSPTDKRAVAETEMKVMNRHFTEKGMRSTFKRMSKFLVVRGMHFALPPSKGNQQR